MDQGTPHPWQVPSLGLGEGGEGGRLDGKAGADDVKGVGDANSGYASAGAAKEAVERRKARSWGGFEVLQEVNKMGMRLS